MTIHIGLMGSGNISRTHSRAARAIPGALISAVFGSNPEKVKQLAAEIEAAPYADLEKFLRHRPLDLVCIGTPSGLHAEQGVAAARHGLHVLTEKPIDVSTERADALIAETEKAGVKLGVFFQDRCKPALAEIKKILDSGMLGKPILADARVKWYRPPKYYSDSRWRGTLALDGGGALINQGVHTLDLFLWLLGDVAGVQARSSTALHKIETEDTLVATLEFVCGALGSLVVATSIYPGYPRRLELSGSNGTLVMENDQITACELQTSERIPIAPPRSSVDQSESSPVVDDIRPHQAVLEDFIQAIKSNTQPTCSGREGRRSLALVEAIYESCRTGCEVLLR